MFEIFLILLSAILLGTLVAVTRQNRGLEKELDDQDTEHALQMSELRSEHNAEMDTRGQVYITNIENLQHEMFSLIQDRNDAQMNLELVLMVNDGVSSEAIHRYIKEHTS